MNYFDLVIEHKSRHTDDLFTYGYEEDLPIGSVVQLKFGQGNRPKRGIVVRRNEHPDYDPSKIKSIDSVDPVLSLNEEMIETCVWMRQRYGITYLDGIRCFLPNGKPPKPGKEKEPYKNLKVEPSEPPELTLEQNLALAKIGGALRAGKRESFLIHGVTGSGKTELYMQATQMALAQGKSVIMLVPEIALTKQIIERFAARFGKETIAVLHSRLTGRERFDEWVRIRKGEARIAIGARIGIFAPVENLGLVIMDEEHESTYKSDQTPKYDTVDIAFKRLMPSKGVMLMGSATPSVVSYNRAQEGLYTLIEMKQRYNEVPLPEVELVDMKEELKRGNRSMFSDRLYLQMKETMEKGSQVILFLNRRGYSTYVSCEDCGEAVKCPDCGISLVYHKRENALICHYCGKKFRLPERCPECGSEHVRYFGSGTEQIEELTQELFPEASVERLDIDTATNTREINRILNSFAKGKTNILIGTQLVAKGLDFKNVGLVGVMSADVSLNIPDYRSTERTFQLVTQVAGRAGRGGERGRVIVQSMSPDNFALQAAARHDYQGYYQQEIMIRNFMSYPPFTDLILVEFTSRSAQTALTQADGCRSYLIRAGLPEADKTFEARLSSNFKGKDSVRYNILIKSPKGERNKYIYYIRYFADQIMKSRIDCAVTIDVNPYSTL